MFLAKVCQHYFSPDCLEERWTNPRNKSVEPRIIRAIAAGHDHPTPVGCTD